MIRGQIFKIGVELVFTFVISIIWLDIIRSREEETNRLISINNEISLKETINNKNLYLINDNSDVNGLENNIITITNNKNEDTSCNLIMLIDKESLVDISYLRFRINNEVKYLDNLIYEDNANYYYLIDKLELKANQDIEEYYTIWLSDEYKDVFNNNALTYKMVVDTKI